MPDKERVIPVSDVGYLGARATREIALRGGLVCAPKKQDLGHCLMGAFFRRLTSKKVVPRIPGERAAIGARSIIKQRPFYF